MILRTERTEVRTRMTSIGRIETHGINHEAPVIVQLVVIVA